MSKDFIITVEDVVVALDAETESLVQPMIVPLEDHDKPFSELVARHKKQFGDDGITVYGVIGFNVWFRIPPAGDSPVSAPATKGSPPMPSLAAFK